MLLRAVRVRLRGDESAVEGSESAVKVRLESNGYEDATKIGWFARADSVCLELNCKHALKFRAGPLSRTLKANAVDPLRFSHIQVKHRFFYALLHVNCTLGQIYTSLRVFLQASNQAAKLPLLPTVLLKSVTLITIPIRRIEAKKGTAKTRN
ncbi:MAG: hypothetical protein J7639_18110 [Paenibacillaceae bacterium]|nr:hypothetical protein [Paenibacillaceae bacterium]